MRQSRRRNGSAILLDSLRGDYYTSLAQPRRRDGYNDRVDQIVTGPRGEAPPEYPATRTDRCLPRPSAP
ncbi:hypothetical protein HYQ45_009553 [Verticillium longisporum]|uniref:Uncharacterized protein n=1 Tax=Verticillium longisporum TaxID=100787 RepID=A0A8I2ZHW5_VERLO|nr:hypothetical protein HYQ45_009553 [Verticillium longisporum]